MAFREIDDDLWEIDDDLWEIDDDLWEIDDDLWEMIRKYLPRQSRTLTDRGETSAG